MTFDAPLIGRSSSIVHVKCVHLFHLYLVADCRDTSINDDRPIAVMSSARMELRHCLNSSCASAQLE